LLSLFMNDVATTAQTCSVVTVVFAVGYVYEANPSPVKFSINVFTVGCYVNRRNVTFL